MDRISFLLCLYVLCVPLCVHGASTLRQVTTVTRHGDRSPCNALPWGFNEDAFDCDLSLYAKYGNRLSDSATGAATRRLYVENEQVMKGTCAVGQLTKTGFLQHVELGGKFRDTYVTSLGFLPSEFDVAKIYVRSTEIQRTLFSAEGFLTGLYPSLVTSQERVNVNLVEQTFDILAPNGALCPKLAKLMSDQFKKPEYLARIANMSDVTKQLKGVFHMDDVPSAAYVAFWDNFFCRNIHDVPLPSGITNATVDELTDFAGFHMGWNFGTTEIQRLSVGPLLALVQSNMDAVDKLTRKFFLYSSHDTTMGALLSAFGIFDGKWPPYASALVLELWEDSVGDLSVRVLYNEVEQQLPACSGSPCPMKDFRSLLETLIPDDFLKECGTTIFDAAHWSPTIPY